MRRPVITLEQKGKIEKEIRNIMLAAPLEIREQWLRDDHITWVLDKPLIQAGLLEKLPRQLKDRYVTLLNSLK